MSHPLATMPPGNSFHGHAESWPASWMFSPLRLAASVVGVVILTAFSARAETISIPAGRVSSSTEIGPPFDRIDDHIVDGSGLNGGQHGGTPDGLMWLSAGSGFGGVDSDPWVLFDLGAVYTITSFHVWNYNEATGGNLTERGVKGVTVEYGTTAVLGSTLPGVTQFAKAPEPVTNSYAGEEFSGFPPFTARYIKFDIASGINVGNWGDGNSFYGLSEVQFEGAVSNIELSIDQFVTSATQGALVGNLSTLSANPGDTFTYSLVSGAGDADNAKFQIGGDELQIGVFDFSGSPDGTTFALRIRSTGSPSGEQIEKNFTLTARADADADELLDTWEERWAGAGNLGVLSGVGGANDDGDSLSDLMEFELRDQFPNLDPREADTDGDTLEDGDEIGGAGARPPTDPTLSDTDGDGLSDRVETNTGTFVSASNTGTDPTETDTDGDTLSDGVESNTGTLVGPTDTGSNPNLADTDADTFRDDLEVAGGSNPSDPNSTPPTPNTGLSRSASSPDAVVVFNEVQFNPPGVSEAGEWIELFNQMGIKTDLSGWRIDGIDYVFPVGTVIDPGGFLVVAKSPLAGQLGPFLGSIDNGGERLRLINQGDRLMDELDFGDNGRWPAAADGSGATLAKLRPYTANKPPENWAVSQQVGGTPGAVNFANPADPDAGPDLVINEVPPASEGSFWVELRNNSGSPIQLAGITISAGADPSREYRLPAGVLSPGDLLTLNEATLGFRPADGEKLFLYNAAGSIVLDGREVTGRLRGRAESRDGAWLYPSVATSGAANSFVFNEDVVISEISYNPPALPPVSGTPATYQNTELFGFGVSWRYNDNNDNLPATWATTAHAVGGNWESGGAPIGLESSNLPVPLVTVLPNYTSSTVTYYFEREFTLTAQQLGNLDSLEITHQIDDGAVFYLNGVAVGDFNMPDGPLTPETEADPGVNNATLNTLPISAAELVVGSNRLSVEVHQGSTGSSDIVFGVKLDARIVLTPGAPGLPFRNSTNQWIEIANRSGNAVDLSGWDFGDGISFVFPANTMLASGEHACIARDTSEFVTAFPAARLLGEFGGSLSRSGERLLLRDAANNPVDEVRYYDSGRWPETPDGGGATLELRDLDADNGIGEAWAASEESGQTAWKNYSYSGTVSSSAGPDSKWSEFNMGLLSAGEILIDDLRVVENGTTQKISNSTFSGGASGWRFRGTHRHSEIVDDPDSPGNKVLRLVASGGTGHMHNQIETTLLSGVNNGQTYEISFRARWVSGSNQLHTRLYFNRLPRATIIDRPEQVGTPSAPNSRASNNIGPTMTELSHAPVVPSAGQSVTVGVTAEDPETVGALSLYYSTGGAFQVVAMSGGAGGRYQASIPGQSAGTVVQFYVRGVDGVGEISMLPARGPDSRALYKVDDGLAATNGQHNFRIVVTNAERDFIHLATEVMSNDRIGATIVDREDDVYYDVKLRLKGSQRARSQDNRVGYNMRFGADNLYRGIHKSMAIDRSEGVGQGQIEILFDFMIANSGGVVSRYYDFIKVLAPKNNHTRSAVLQMARYDDVLLNSQFENGSDGNLYEYELLYTPNNADGNGSKLPQPDGVTGTNVSDKGDDKERYRWFFLKKNNRDADDFAPIIAYNKKFSQSGAAFENGLEEVVDLDAWFRGMAYAVLSGAGDNAGANSQHNGMYYARPDGRVMFLPHDMDFSFSTSRSIFANSQCSKLTEDPARKRIYLGHLHDIITTTYNNSYMSMWTSHLASFDSGQNWSGHLTYMTNRSNNVLSQINGQIGPVPFSIVTSSPLTVADSVAVVTGEGWVNVREIRIAGTDSPLVVTWLDGNSWRVNLPVAPGSHSYTLQAHDFSGELIGDETITIENTTATEPASAANLVISEMMYHPAAPSPAEVLDGFSDGDLFEFVELMNIGAAPVDLTGVVFSGAFDFALPSTTIAPGARVVVARDRSAFLSRHPGAGGKLLGGEYFGAGDTNQLSNNGEEVVLTGGLGAEIRRFTYDDDPDWPTSPDGGGYSLVLIAPESNPPHGNPFSWRPSTMAFGNPGSSDAAPAFMGDPNVDLDRDGIEALLEHAFGTSENNPDPAEGYSNGTGLFDDGTGSLRRYLTISYRHNLAADDLIIEVEASPDLVAWSPLSTVFVSAVHNGDGTETVTYRSTTPIAFLAREFMRLSVRSR